VKKSILITSILFYSFQSFSQLKIDKKEGSSVVIKLSTGIKVNDGSTLKKEYIIINDTNCPIQMVDVGIETSYAASEFSFNPIGLLKSKEPIVAYEVVHLIYNVFGEHMESLSNTEIIDFEGEKNFSRYSSWYASENNVGEYLICISYVSNVRTKSGKIWHYNFKALKEQLNKIEFTFEEGFVPKKNVEKDK
jgi:hypothetical protein